MLLPILVFSLFYACENPLAEIIAADTAPRYGVITIRQNDVIFESGTEIFDFGSVTVGENLTIDFTIVNSGDNDLLLSGDPLVAVGGTGSTAYSVTSMPGSRIAAGDTSPFSVRFAPSSSGNHIATITIQSDDLDNSTFVFSIIGTGVEPPEPEIKVTTSGGTFIPTGGSFDFGSTVVDTPKEYSFVIENSGAGDLILSGSPKISFTGTDAADFSPTLLPSSPVPSGGSSSFTVELDSSDIETKSATLVIESNDADEGTYTISLSGEVTEFPAPEIHILQGTTDIPCDIDTGTYEYTFEDTTLENSTEVDFTIQNKGSADLTLGGSPRVDISGSGFTVTAQPSSPVDEEGGLNDETTFTVSFGPSSVGQKAATISIVNDDSDEDPYTFDITGIALDPEIDISQGGTPIASGAGSYTFADTTLGTYTDIIFTIDNPGATELILSGTLKAALSGTDADQFTVTAQPSSPVAASGGSTTFTVRFEPDSFGVKDAALTIENNDGDENPYTFSISGECTGPEMDVNQGGTDIADGGSYTFEDTRLDTPQEIVFTIENNGTEALILDGSPIVEISGTDADLFTVTVEPSSPVGVSGSTTFTLEFAPDTIGDKSATMTISNDDYDEGNFAFSVNGKAAWAGVKTLGVYSANGMGSTDIAIDDNNIYIVYIYTDTSTSDPYLCFTKSENEGYTWPIDLKPSVSDRGSFPSVAVSSNNIYISFFSWIDFSTMNQWYLKFAKSTDSGATWPSENINYVNDSQSAGWYNSLSISNSNIYISYFDEVADDLRFTRSSDGGETWPSENIETVDSSGAVGIGTSIASAGSNVYISYYNQTDGEVKFAKSTDYGATWSTSDIRIIDSGGLSSSNSIVCSDTRIIISYNDTDGNLNCARSTDSGDTWDVITVDAVGSGYSAAMSGDDVFISYNNGSGLTIAKSTDGGVTWPSGNIVSVDSTAWESCSVAADGNYVYISYVDASAKSLKIAKSIDGGVTW